MSFPTPPYAVPLRIPIMTISPICLNMPLLSNP